MISARDWSAHGDAIPADDLTEDNAENEEEEEDAASELDENDDEEEADEGVDEADPEELREGDFLAEDLLRNHRREDDVIDVAALVIELLCLVESAFCEEFGCGCPDCAAFDSGTRKFLPVPAGRTG